MNRLLLQNDKLIPFLEILDFIPNIVKFDNLLKQIQKKIDDIDIRIFKIEKGDKNKKDKGIDEGLKEIENKLIY